MKNQENIPINEEQPKKTPVINFKGMEVSKLLGKIQNNHLKEAQWATREHRQLNEIKERIYEQNEKFNNRETI